MLKYNTSYSSIGRLNDSNPCAKNYFSARRLNFLKHYPGHLNKALPWIVKVFSAKLFVLKEHCFNKRKNADRNYFSARRLNFLKHYPGHLNKALPWIVKVFSAKLFVLKEHCFNKRKN